ncbi:MAG: OsmC family protein [Balneola sp.]
MNDVHQYEVNLNWLADRKGNLSSPVLDETINVATPPEFSKGMPGIWSPEHLYVASVSSCLMTTFLAIAEFSKLEYLTLEVNATGTLEKIDGKFMMSEIKLKPILTIPTTSSSEKADRILHKSEAACLISNSIKSKITLETRIIVKEEEMA